MDSAYKVNSGFQVLKNPRIKLQEYFEKIKKIESKTNEDIKKKMVKINDRILK